MFFLKNGLINLLFQKDDKTKTLLAAVRDGGKHQMWAGADTRLVD